MSDIRIASFKQEMKFHTIIQQSGKTATGIQIPQEANRTISSFEKHNSFIANRC